MQPSRARRYLTHSYLVAAVAIVVIGYSCAQQSGPPPELFEEAAAQMGLDYTQFRPYECFDPIPCGPLYMSGGAAAGDYDNDGFVDLVVTRVNEKPILYRNEGGRRFADTTAGSGLDIPEANRGNGVAFVDVDGDSCLDIAMTVVSSFRNLLFMGDCKGHFREEGLLRGFAEERSQPSVYGYGIAAGDYDNDGYLDLYVGAWRFDLAFPGAPSDSRLLRNRGLEAPGYFEDASKAAEVVPPSAIGALLTGSFWWTPAFVDLDGDGFQDLLQVGDFKTTKLYWNDGDGTFTDGTQSAGMGTDENGMGLALGDYDNDGLIDVFVSSIYQTDMCEVAHNKEEICAHWGISGNRMFLNNGDRTFTDATDEAGVRNGRWGWGASFFDFDNDGLLDLAQTAGQFFPYPDFRTDNFFEDPTFLWKNLDGRRFAEVSSAAGFDRVRRGKGLVVLDFDKDGLYDVLVVQNSAEPRLFRNRGHGSPGNWLHVDLRGAGPGGGGGNPQGIGAKVRVKPQGSGAWLTAQATGGSSFLGQNEDGLHFGLGTAPAAESVDVWWPVSRCRQEISDVAAGTRLILSEQDCLRRQAPSTG